VPHIRRVGEEKLDNTGKKSQPARRWVVEHCGAWMNRCRAILVRYTKRSCKLPLHDHARVHPAVVPKAQTQRQTAGFEIVIKCA
jgi:hypothetical protein